MKFLQHDPNQQKIKTRFIFNREKERTDDKEKNEEEEKKKKKKVELKAKIEKLEELLTRRILKILNNREKEVKEEQIEDILKNLSHYFELIIDEAFLDQVLVEWKKKMAERMSQQHSKISYLESEFFKWREQLKLEKLKNRLRGKYVKDCESDLLNILRMKIDDYQNDSFFSKEDFHLSMMHKGKEGTITFDADQKTVQYYDDDTGEMVTLYHLKDEGEET